MYRLGALTPRVNMQLPRKEAEKAGMTDIPIIARRICRTKVNTKSLVCLGQYQFSHMLGAPA